MEAHDLWGNKNNLMLLLLVFIISTKVKSVNNKHNFLWFSNLKNFIRIIYNQFHI